MRVRIFNKMNRVLCFREVRYNIKVNVFIWIFLFIEFLFLEIKY